MKANKIIQFFFILLFTTPSIAETNLGRNLNCKLLKGTEIEAFIHKFLNVDGRRVVIARIAEDVYSTNGGNKIFKKSGINETYFIGQLKQDTNTRFNNKLLINWKNVEIKENLVLMLDENNVFSLLNSNITIGDKFIIMITKDIDFTNICEK